VTRELLVGTRKGLFALTERNGGFEVGPRSFVGQVVEYAMRDPRTDTYLASVTHGQHGPHVFFTDDPAGKWEEADGPAFPKDTGATLERTWIIERGEADGVLWAGVDPAALFKSTDGGRSWSLMRGLWDEPSRPDWQPGGGGLCLHSIVPWPGDPSKLAIAISAAGVWLTDDGGETWRRGNKGLVARYVPEGAPEETNDLCVHKLRRHPLQPETIYMQFHGGVYRSDDAGESWQDIASGLPSDFGFPLAIHPRDPNRAFIIPLNGDFDRVTVDGKLRVFQTRDRGETWSPLGNGLPDSAWLTILRQSFCNDAQDPLGLYFGSTTGELFGSLDEGKSWKELARGLPPILSVTAI
jgi:photosystem II stability/assembly factor-like uncharacterized protein